MRYRYLVLFVRSMSHCISLIPLHTHTHTNTKIVNDPVTGQPKKKKTLGGAYPGQRTPTHAPYTPPTSDFQPNGAGMSTATAHFIQYGGGNALVLGTNPTATPQSGKAQPLFVAVTLPQGVAPGDVIHVRAPDGRLNAICVPPGFYPGDSFTVEFVDAAPVAKQEQQVVSPAIVPAVTMGTAAGGDDGFATGFNNPGYTPVTATATAPTGEPDIDLTVNYTGYHRA